MKQLAIKFLSISSTLLLVSCAGIKLVEDRKKFKKTSRVEDYSYTVYIPYVRYVATPLDMDNLCKKKEWKDVYVSGNVLGGLVSFITIGIVHPQKTEATCLN